MLQEALKMIIETKKDQSILKEKKVHVERKSLRRQGMQTAEGHLWSSPRWPRVAY